MSGIRAWIRCVLLVLGLAVLTQPVLAQDDAGRLTRMLQDSLSGAGRTVTITGFRGALSSTAQMDRLTIADDDGIWLTMSGVTLQWNRAALLAGTLDVRQLVAEEIVVSRLPRLPDDGLPPAEAQPFALPSLPVAISLGEISAKAITLGPEVLGTEVQATLSADASLIGGQGHIRLALERTDTEGKLSLIAVYANATNTLTLAVEAQEPAGGLVVTALGIPGAPPAHLTFGGKGPLDDFTASLKLETDGITRLAGQLTTSRAGGGATAFDADLAGNLAPLFLPGYADFLGEALHLQVAGQRESDGALQIGQMDLTTQALRLRGSLDLSADGLPSRVDLTGDIAQASGAPALLPLPGEPTRIASATLRVGYDRAVGPEWTAEATVLGLSRADLSADRLVLTGRGEIKHGSAAGADDSLRAAITLQGQGLAPADPALAQALGPEAALQVMLDWQRGDGHVALEDLALTAGDAAFSGQGVISGLSTGFKLEGEFAASADDLTRFAAITGQPLDGLVRGQMTGWLSPLSGQFDAEITLAGQDLQIGQPQADALLAGVASIQASAVRNEAGIAVRQFDIQTESGLSASLAGQVATAGSDLQGTLALDDMTPLGLGLSGGLSGQARFIGTPQDARVTLAGAGQDLATGQAQLDALGRGTTALDLDLHLAGTRVDIAKAHLSNPAFGATAQGYYDPGGSDLSADVRFPDLAVLGTGASGGLDARLRATGVVGDAQVTLTGTGQDLALGQAQLDALGRGTTALDLDLHLAGTRVDIAKAHLSNPGFEAMARGFYAPEGSDLSADVSLPDVAVLGTGASGGLTASLRATGTPQDAHVTLDGTGTDLALGQVQADALSKGKTALSLDLQVAGQRVTVTRADLTGPSVRVAASGLYDPAGSDLSVRLDLPELAVLQLGYRGAVKGDLRLTGTAKALRAGITAQTQALSIGNPLADRLLAGAGTLDADVQWNEGQRLQFNALNARTPAFAVKASGQPEALAVEARLTDLSSVMPEFPGPMAAQGTLRQSASGTGLDLAVRGPGQINAQVQGSIAPGFATANLTARGTAQAALANVLIAPRVAVGPVSFDLALRGPFKMSSVSGTASLTEGRLADPNLPFSLVGATAQARLSAGTAVVTVNSGISTGGRMTVTGSVGLAPPMPADLKITLSQATFRDPQLYTVTMDGNLTFRGPALGGGKVAGSVNLTETELRVPTSSVAPLPVLESLHHTGDSAEVRQTRVRAGMEGGAPRRPGSSASGGYGLDVLVTARNQVFVRGRGLDAELGGQVRLTGTTAAIVPSGSMDLIRGRLDLLGKRLVLSRASLQMQGALVPWVDIAATTTSEEFDISVLVRGNAFDPEVSFTSDPELPQEEVLARLLFDSGLQNLSPFQLAQLASAVATLAGSGGEGIIGRVRNAAGLVNLDVVADDEGRAAITAGRYLTDKLYTELTVGQDGQSVLNLNLDVSRSITLRGTLDDNGDSSLGVVLEKDY